MSRSRPGWMKIAEKIGLELAVKAEQDFSNQKAVCSMGGGWGIRARATSKERPARRSPLYTFSTTCHNSGESLNMGQPSGACLPHCTMQATPFVATSLDQIPVPWELHCTGRQRGRTVQDPQPFIPSQSPVIFPGCPPPCFLENLLFPLPVPGHPSSSIIGFDFL